MSQYERGLTFAIKQIEDIRFPFCKVTSPFCPSSAFSQLDFEIEAYVRDDRPSRVGLSLKELFKVEAVDPAFDSALKFIVNGKNHIWPPFTTSTTERSEKDVMVTLCKILTPLSSEVILEGTYKTHLALERESVLLSVGDIGIGSVHTWHGSPDARVRGVPVVCLKAAEDSNFQFEVLDDGSDDESVTASECKVVVRPKNLKQAIATCVVSSFIAKARHPDKPAVVPTILINENQFCVCLYDCEKDVLMISDHRLLATNGHLSRSGLAFLWLVINHRLFLQELPDEVTKYPALIKSQLETFGRLDYFTSLTNNNINWNSAHGSWMKNMEFPIGPPPKRRRTENGQSPLLNV